jgi:plastocyanin
MIMRLSSFSRARILAAFSIVLVGLGVACFSDHSVSTATNSVGSCTTPGTAAGATVIFIHGLAFDPVSVHVKAGGTVVWVNCESPSISHTATSDASGFNSGAFAAGASFLHVFATAGTIPYHCDIHPFMKATVIVDP